LGIMQEFAVASPRPLPIFVLADVSGSMGERGKISSLNYALREMTTSLAGETPERVDIQVAVITFGGSDAKLHIPLTSASKVQWCDLSAAGVTPLDSALTMVTGMIEDVQLVPRRAYRPVIVLVTDGLPTDSNGNLHDGWKLSMAKLLASDRGKKADRFALGIGDDVDLVMLTDFLHDPAKSVMKAEDAKSIRTFFKWVTMSVTVRSRSTTPNSVPPLPPPDLDLDF
jgi:uncharacterized protein YegL